MNVRMYKPNYNYKQLFVIKLKKKIENLYAIKCSVCVDVNVHHIHFLPARMRLSYTNDDDDGHDGVFWRLVLPHLLIRLFTTYARI